MHSRRQKLSFPQTHRELFHSLWKVVWRRTSRRSDTYGGQAVSRYADRIRAPSGVWKTPEPSPKDFARGS